MPRAYIPLCSMCITSDVYMDITALYVHLDVVGIKIILWALYGWVTFLPYGLFSARISMRETYVCGDINSHDVFARQLHRTRRRGRAGGGRGWDMMRLRRCNINCWQYQVPQICLSASLRKVCGENIQQELQQSHRSSDLNIPYIQEQVSTCGIRSLCAHHRDRHMHVKIGKGQTQTLAGN